LPEEYVTAANKEILVKIILDEALTAALHEAANHQGIAPEELALRTLREHFLSPTTALQPQDEWERGLLEAARDCGVSLPDAALSSEGLYDEWPS
jgi:hypothetical protein